MLASALTEIPWSLTIHGPTEFQMHETLALDEKIARAKFTVAISDFCKSQLMRSWSVPARSSTTVAYNSSRWRRIIGCLRSISGVRLPKPAA